MGPLRPVRAGRLSEEAGPGSALQDPQMGRRQEEALLGRFPGPFQGTSSCCPVPHLWGPINLVTVVNYRLHEAQGRKAVDVWGAGGVPAWLSGREAADTKAPIKLPRTGCLYGLSGWGHDITRSNQGPLQTFFLFWDLSLWLLKYILSEGGAFFWNAWTQWVSQPLAMPVLFQPKPTNASVLPKPPEKTESAALHSFQAMISNFFE